MTQRLAPYKRCFDFEIGYLVQSPCRKCTKRDQFPGCEKDCRVIDEIRSLLSQAIPSTRSYSNLEAHAISIESWRGK